MCVHTHIYKLYMYIYIKMVPIICLLVPMSVEMRIRPTLFIPTLPPWQTQLKIFRLVNINVLSYKLRRKGWKWEASVAKEKVLRKPAMQASWAPRILWALLALWLAIPQALFLTELRCLSPRRHLLSSPFASRSQRIESHAAWLWHIHRHDYCQSLRSHFTPPEEQSTISHMTTFTEELLSL